jgi:hypothetical protein
LWVSGEVYEPAEQPQRDGRSSIEHRRVWILTAELNRRDQVTAPNSWPNSRPTDRSRGRLSGSSTY